MRFQRREQLIERFQLDPRARLQHLSKGQYAKVALALALAPDPQVLILDEPTSGLDLLVRREFLESMVDLAAAGRTVLLSSHQIHEVERVADYVAIVHDGRLVMIDLPQVVDVIANPRGAWYLTRDAENIGRWFTRQGLDGVRPEPADLSGLLRREAML